VFLLVQFLHEVCDIMFLILTKKTALLVFHFHFMLCVYEVHQIQVTKFDTVTTKLRK
jgi:hypothetical protein